MNMLRDLLQPTRRNLLRGMFTATSALTRFAVNGVEAALALDFIGSEYRTGNTSTTFADAFMGNSPKLTYDPGSASSSQSTMVNSAGHLVWAPHNLLTYSEDFTDATWSDNPTITPNATAPDGSLNAHSYTHTATSGERIAKAVSVGSAITTTFAVYAKASTNAQWLRFFFHSGQTGTGDNVGAWFDLLNGNTGTTGAAGAGTLVSTDISDVGNGWYRCSVTGSVASSTSYVGFMYLSDADNSTTRDNGSTVLFYGAHVYRSDLGGMAPVPGAVGDFQYYVPTNGNAEYLPRVGHHVHNGSTWVNEGLLIESEQRTNLVTYSEDFTDASWKLDLTRITRTPNAAVSPSGQTDATLYVPYTQNRIRYTGLDNLSSNTYTFSVYAKSNGGANDQISIWLAGATQRAVFDLGAGTVNNINLTDAWIEDVGNGWYRCSGYSSTATTAARIYFQDGNAFAGNDSDGIYLWGAQLELGSFATSYIPTSGSTVTRGGQSLVVPAHWYDVDSPTYTGPELVTNGGFDTDTDWTKGTGWAINTTTGVASHAAGSSGNLDQSMPLVTGAAYEVRLTLSNVSAGQVQVYLQGSAAENVSAPLTGNGDYSFTLVAGTATSYDLSVNGSSTFVGSIDNVSVRQVSAPQFGWPEPEYIGPELVDNGGFATDTDWTKGTGWTINTTTGEAVHDEASGGGFMYQDVTVEAGKVYSVVWDIASEPVSSGGATNTSIQIFEGPETTLIWGISNFNSPDYELFNGSLRYEAVVVPSVTTMRLRSYSDDEFSIDNISVREINPLSVSIQMDGRMTYADEGSFDTVQFLLWFFDGNNQVYNKMDTDTYRTGRTVFNQRALGTLDFVLGDNADYSPGINVPFNISSRHGSTFVNGAVDGVALTANTTPTALPDLSGTDLEIAPDFMGTIGTFRQFAGDIGDAGLVTATNPSTEPTLSLTFDGTGGSFYNLSWSE